MMERKRDGEWQQVRHRRRVSSETTTFFVSGLPEKTYREDVKKLFFRFGKVVDVYVAERKDASGKFFAFIRYGGVTNVEKLEEHLQNVRYQGFPLSVNVARFGRKPVIGEIGRQNVPAPKRQESYNYPRMHKSTMDNRSFAEVLIGGRNNCSSPSIPLKVDTEMNRWLKKSVLIGEAHSLNHIATFHIHNKLGVITKYLGGGLNMALDFVHSKDAKDYLEDKSRWEIWFKWLKYGDEEDIRFERMAWLKIVGLPLRLWDEDNFSKIVGNFGRVVNPFDGIYDRRDLSMGKVGVVTSRRVWINEELLVEAGGKTFKVGVVEYTDDWSPFHEFPYDKTVEYEDEAEEDEDEEESEGISETWVGMEDDREEGEFIPHDHINVPDPVDAPANVPDDSGGSYNVASENGNNMMAVEIQEDRVEESVGNIEKNSRLNSAGRSHVEILI
ncbi:hypothetical protein L1887_10689 [Cichorium endivia]|nr:hypothetical protein L1887_10689 [Cichorium endivia]